MITEKNITIFPENSSPIGIMDSGVGGLTVLQELRSLMPYEQYIYCADTKNAPYGEKSQEELYIYATALVEYLLSQKVKCIVIACNTISGNVLHRIRANYPTVLFIDMIEAGLQDITHILENKKNKIPSTTYMYNTEHIALLATRSTVEEGTYIKTLQKKIPNNYIKAHSASQLVLWAEAGITQGKEVEDYIRSIFSQYNTPPSSIILGCTHFPFFIDTMQSILPETVYIYNPAHSVAQAVYTLCSHIGFAPKNTTNPHILWYITGNTSVVEAFAQRLYIEH